MKTLKLICFLLLLSLAGIAQTTRTTVADETELVTLKTSFKIETSNEQVFSLLISDLKDIVTKYTVTIKKDRSGSYNLYSVPFKQTEFEKVLSFFKNIE